MRTPRSLTRLAPLALAAVLIPTQALAYKHTGLKWCDPEDMPLPYYVSDYEEDSLPGVDLQEVIARSYEAWSIAAPCSGVEVTYEGVCENSPYTLDYENRHTFDDPADQLATGVLGETLSRSGSSVCSINGDIFRDTIDADIQYNNNIDWALDEDIDNALCNDETSLQSVATHEIGHSFGLGHSCDDGEPCDDPVLQDATMFWTADSCDTNGSTPNDDDVLSLNLLYGHAPTVNVVCSNELEPGADDTVAFGVVPWELRCRVESDYRMDVLSVDWQWGDGSPNSTGLDAVHQYTAEGNYSIQAVITGNTDSCGDWDQTVRKVGYVRSCDVPLPEFELNHVNGLEYDFRNHTPVNTYGCVNNISWDIFDDSGAMIAQLKAWEPTYEFPENGTYRVVLNVAGPAGQAAADVTFDAKNHRGDGYSTCSTVPVDTGLLGVAVGVMGAIALRRRRS